MIGRNVCRITVAASTYAYTFICLIRPTIAKLSQVISVFQLASSLFYIRHMCNRHGSVYMYTTLLIIPYVENYMHMVEIMHRVRAPIKQDTMYIIILRCEGNCCVRVVVSLRVWSKAFPGMAPF